MKEWLISINNHTYAGDRIYVDNAIKAGKEAMRGRNAIVAVEKGNVVFLLSEPHKTIKELNKARKEYIDLGFKVYTA
jgi:hypothetical protein